jgi:hypothetical protein
LATLSLIPRETTPQYNNGFNMRKRLTPIDKDIVKKKTLEDVKV